MSTQEPKDEDKADDASAVGDAAPGDSIPISVSSTAIPVADESSASGSRARRASEMVTDVVSDGVGHLGGGLSKVGTGIHHIGASVEKLPGAGRLGLGAGVKELGDGLVDVGASLSTLPAMSRTPYGRVLVRSMIVSFLLVFTWIAIIVAFGRRGGEKPDLRAEAEAILVQLRNGEYQKLYESASPRFQEVTVYERFAADMKEANAVLGPFQEIAAVNRTDVHRGPSGRVVNVELLAVFAKDKARSNVSFQWLDGRWRLLGIGFELLDQSALAETRSDRRADRVKAPPEVRLAIENMLVQLRDGKVAEVWAAASPLFQSSVSKAELERLESERRAVLGAYRQVLTMTRSKTNPQRTGASVEALLEFEKATITSTFNLERVGEQWRLTAYRVVLPMPRTRTGPLAPPGLDDPSSR